MRGPEREGEAPSARPWEEPAWPAWDGATLGASALDEGARGSDAADARTDARGAGAVEAGGTDGGRAERAEAGVDAASAADGRAPCVPRVWVSELQTGAEGAGGVGEEFVELRNAGACEVPLYGWTVRYLSATGASGRLLWSGTTEVLEASAYFVVGSSSVLERLAPDVLRGELRGVGTSGALSATGGAVALFAPGRGAEGTEPEDSVGYAAAPTNRYVRGQSAAAPPAGRSLARHEAREPRGDNSEDFYVTASPTPGGRNR